MTPGDPSPRGTAAADDPHAISRELTLACRGCDRPFVLMYRYGSAEGMSPRRIRCPHRGCQATQDVYLPINAYDLKRSPA
jgi:hypothetical protein